MIRRALIFFLFSTAAWAHKPSDSYMRLKPDGALVHGRWDIAIRDLDVMVGLDSNNDGSITWDEISSRGPSLTKSVLEHITFAQALTVCGTTPGELQAVRHSDGVYVVFHFDVQCPQPVKVVDLSYSLLFDLDAQHRGLVRLEGSGSDSWTVFTANERKRTIEWVDTTPGAQLWLALKQGVHHIMIGWDHLCFLFALLLPSVLRRKDRTWVPADSLRPTLTEVLKVVTSFTVAHSLTLGLAAFDIVAPEPKWVEVAIALSVALAALNNIAPFLPEGRWALAFGLGLLHGFGFVSALVDLGGARLWLSVLGFNLGVEAGQASIVAVFVPTAFLLRKTVAYRYLLQLASIGIFITALYWTWQRL